MSGINKRGKTTKVEQEPVEGEHQVMQRGDDGFQGWDGEGKMVACRGGAGQRAAGSRLKAAAKTSSGVLGSSAERLTACRLPRPAYPHRPPPCSRKRTLNSQ